MSLSEERQDAWTCGMAGDSHGIAAREAGFDAILAMCAFHIRHGMFMDRH